MERYVEHLYNKILHEIVIPETGNDVTYLKDLLRIGNRLLLGKFHGVYPSDKMPRLTKSKPYAILNVDKSNQPGSHWVAVARINGTTYIYDSFGRKTKKLIPDLNSTIRDIDTKDAEQKSTEDNCGARVMAFLLLIDRFGLDYARHL